MFCRSGLRWSAEGVQINKNTKPEIDLIAVSRSHVIPVPEIETTYFLDLCLLNSDHDKLRFDQLVWNTFRAAVF
jgi:hypothetical protein